jgi:hypothetical protein
MTTDHGPLHTYEVVWASGHVEQIQAHQCLMPMTDNPFLSALATDTKRVEYFKFHGQIDGHWILVLAARVEDVLSVRLISEDGAS